MIKPIDSVKLLGVHLDRYLTMRDHIDYLSQKAHGFVGTLNSSGILASAAKSNLTKLDVNQKTAFKNNL